MSAAEDTKLPYVWTKPGRGGQDMVYYRRRLGPDVFTTRLPGPGEAGFTQAYYDARRMFEAMAEARTSKPATTPVPRLTAPPEFTVNALILSYRSQPEWRKLSAVSQQHYIRRFGIVADFTLAGVKLGDMDARSITRANVRDMRAALASIAPSRANEAVAALSMLLAYAVRELEWRDSNPCERIDKVETGDGYKAWTPADLAKAMASDKISEPVRRAILLAAYTGLRRGDLCALPKSAIRDGAIEWTTQKTGADVYIPVHPALAAALASAPPCDADTVLSTVTGRPWTVTHLNHTVLAELQAAGLPGLSLHGLRKMLTNQLAQAGLGDAAIEAIIPHADPRQTKFYRKAADQKMLARQAMAALSGPSGK